MGFAIFVKFTHDFRLEGVKIMSDSWVSVTIVVKITYISGYKA